MTVQHYDSSTNSNNVLFDELTSIISESSGSSKDELTRDSQFKEIFEDSLEVVECLMQIETKYGVEISDDDASDLKTINDVISYISEKTRMSAARV